MQFTPVPARSWLAEAWRHKTSVLTAVLALVSLSLAHYAGFLVKVPLQIVAVAGAPLAKGVTATFLFYVFFCAVSARVLAAVVQLMALPFVALGDRLGRGFGWKMSWPQQRRFVRTHTATIKWEGMTWFLLQSLLFLLMMLAIYVQFEDTWLSLSLIAGAIVLVVLSGLVRAGFFLQPKPGPFVRKARQRPARKGRLTSAILVTLTGALVVVAFIMGMMRASLLRDQEPHMVVTKEFTGMAAVIASSDEALLLFQKQDRTPGSAVRYVFSTPEFTTSVETRRVFPPIGAGNAK